MRSFNWLIPSNMIASFTDYSQQITFNVGVVNGGSVVNRVPHHAEALVEMRAFSPDSLREWLSEDDVIEWQHQHNQS